MRSATCKALALALALGMSAPCLAADEAAAQAMAPHSQEEARPEGRAGEGSSFNQTLSTLGAVALGVIGLLWVRRHTAQL